ncbi:hypothetical protein D9M72_460510 [compost metagenome]
MLGVQNHGHVERVHDFGHLLFAEGHPEEVGVVSQIVAGLNQFQAMAAALVVSHHGRHGGEQVDGLLHVCFARGVLGKFMPRSHHGRRSPAHVHRVGRDGQRVDHLLDHRIQPASGPFLGRELGQLLRSGQFAVPEQVGHFFETAGGGKFLDGVAAVQQ